MEKKVILIIYLLSLLHSYSQNSGTCSYTITPIEEQFEIKKDDTDLTKKTKKMLSKAFEIVENFNLFLKFNTNESISYIDEGMVNESIKSNYLYPVALAMAGNGIFYTNISEKNKLNQLDIMGESFLISDDFNSNWDITNETKTIGKYKCIKAISTCESCNKADEVWFTNQIPIKFGPLGYNGLPGLVIQVKTKSAIIELEKINFSKKEIIDRPKKGKKITRKEYISLTKKVRNSYKN